MYFVKLMIKIMTKYWQKHRWHRRDSTLSNTQGWGTQIDQTRK